MPSSMTHLLCAKILSPDAQTKFFVGNISPDCIDVREFKDRTHFRDIPEDERLDALRAMARRLDLCDSYQFGAVYHLFADYTWDTGPQAAHRAWYRGESWFRDYRAAINECGREIYRRYAWSAPLWDEMATLDPAQYSAIPEYPPEAIRAFILHGRESSARSPEKPSEFFTPDLVDAYCAETAERFAQFVKTI